MKISAGWTTTTDFGARLMDVSPDEDVIAHDMFSWRCVCGPKLVRLPNMCEMVVHAALDGRELVE